MSLVSEAENYVIVALKYSFEFSKAQYQFRVSTEKKLLE